MKKQLLIIDASSFIYRAFYAFPPIKNKNGELSNALYGFIMLFLKAIKDIDPDFIAIAYDVKGPTFRNEEFKDYKANRAKTPDDLIKQIPSIKEFVKSFNVSSFEKQGFEADDIIGTIAALAFPFSGLKTIILSNDKDNLQLVNEKTLVYLPKTGKKIDIYNKSKVIERFNGITPSQFADFRGLTGDPSDNIPGVLGIGEKTAIKLINEFNDLDKLYKMIDLSKTVLADSIIKKLINGRENAFFSKKLSIIKKDLEIDFVLEDTSFKKYRSEKVKKFLEFHGFKGLIKALPDDFKTKKKNIKDLEQGSFNF